MRQLKRRIEAQERRLGRDRVRLRGERLRLQREMETLVASPAALGLGFGAGLAAGLRRPAWRSADAPSMLKILLPFAQQFLAGLEAGRQPSGEAPDDGEASPPPE